MWDSIKTGAVPIIKIKIRIYKIRYKIMAICTLNRNLLKTTSCGYSLPEIVDIYLANYSDVTTASGQTGELEGCEAISGISATTIYHIEPLKNSTTFTDELVVNDNGSKYRTHTLSFGVPGTFDECMHGTLDALSLGRYFAVVKTAEGKYLALGRLTGLEAETATLAGGGDTNNGIEVTLSANVTESAYVLTDGAVAQLLALVPED